SLYNPLIQAVLVAGAGQATTEQRRSFYVDLLHQPSPTTPQIARVALLDADDAELLRISQSGVLALDLAEMQAIQGYFRQEERAPTDGELETLAQTWSEHCSHKTFKAKVRYRTAEARGLGLEASKQLAFGPYIAYQMLEQDCEIDSLIKTFLMSATKEVLARHSQASSLKSQASEAWVLSAFVDNAGIIAFGDAHEVSIKVETHNH